MLTVDEARNSMFAGAEFSSEVKLDKAEWEKAKKKAEEEAAAQQGGGFDYASLMGGEEAPPEEAPPEEELPPEQADPAAQQVQQDSWWTTFRRSDATYPKVYDRAVKAIAQQYRDPRSAYAKAALAHNYVEGCRREKGTDRGVLRTDSTQQSAIVLRSWFSRQWQQLG